ncbi:peroxisome biogenesis factor 1 [Coprinopsis cinerea okayama7|uniref:Peroxisomal ATPase PEX1 n=1 Tax=Coprinopsis cinerea (strain Okayama-7 / 130 / ATCC MYA-4618 / FGSC 9003) TaxID=240176 RepID=A8N6B6_COPC7|nr:peroxisome biogenesis factor 1 [Coprinopsis cinerea okayama7\|eukprot:XP_001830385.2 peroxisome biogenesis factor 1 [Coprinopsis cinerea okayama7\
MASASSLAQFNSAQGGQVGFETIEIDPQFAQGLGFMQGDVVEIGLLHDLSIAQMVNTEPVTSDDWEIIEIHASHVESTLLSQVRVAKIGQEINVWVLGRTRVRLTVTGLEPQNKGNALLLTTNTEVSIAPKLHKSQSPAKKPVKPDGKPTPPQEKQSASESSSKQLPAATAVLRVLPSNLCPGLDFSETKDSEIMAYVSRKSFPQEAWPSKGRDAEGTLYGVQMKRLTPPVDPSSSKQLEPETQPKSISIGAGAKTDTNEDKFTTPSNQIFIGHDDDLPISHIVFSVLPEGVEEWDLVRISIGKDAKTLVINQDSGASTLSSPILPVEPPTFLAGVDDILEHCVQYCSREYLNQSSSGTVNGVPGLLVTGLPGSGKSSIVRSVARSLQQNRETLAFTYYVDVSRYAESPIANVKALFTYWFDRVSWHRPGVLVLDNLDKLLGAEVEHADSFRSRLLTEVFLRTFSSGSRLAPLNAKGIVVIATASSVAGLHPRLNSSHIFKEVVNVKPPNRDARRDIISRIVNDRLEATQDITANPNLNFTALATQTEGYSASDLQDLVARAIHQVAMRISSDPSAHGELSYEDFTKAQAEFVPLTLRDVKLEKSSTSWSDIGGLFETKRVLRETLEWPTKYGPIFSQSPLRLRSGLLLYGYPGCGKTLLASAVAKECGLNFISVKGPEILNKYIGASEKSVRDLFERASAAKPCVLFFDEFDSIAPKRGHDSTGVTDRVVNQLLTQMDGAEGLDGVYVLAATSRPDLIDSALLRPGRLDKSVLCDMPDLDDRKDILRAVAKKLTFSASINLDRIAEMTEGYSGADLQALLYNAHLDAIHASLDTSPISQTSSQETEIPIKYQVIGGSGDKATMSRAETSAFERRLKQIQSSRACRSKTAGKKEETTRPTFEKKTEVQEEDILKAMKTMRPSVSVEERRRLGRIYRAFVSDRSGEMPVPPEGGGIGSRATLG